MIAIFGHKLFDRKCKYTNKIEQHIKHTNTLKICGYRTTIFDGKKYRFNDVCVCKLLNVGFGNFDNFLSILSCSIITK